MKGPGHLSVVRAGFTRRQRRVRGFSGADQAVMNELEHAFRFNDAVLRHLSVQRKKADTGPSSMMKTVEREEARKAQQQSQEQSA